MIMAGAVIASVPAIMMFIIAQRQVIESVSRSGLRDEAGAAGRAARLSDGGTAGRLRLVEGSGSSAGSDSPASATGTGASGSASGDGYVNPVWDQDFPDPAVLAADGRFIAYATQGNNQNIQTLSSTDLVHWQAGPDALPQVGRWASAGNTWAPGGDQDRQSVQPLLRRP